jgi:hypothetical protein
MTSNFGAKPCFLSSLRISRSAARPSHRGETRTSRFRDNGNSPLWRRSKPGRCESFAFAFTGNLPDRLYGLTN